MILKPSEEVEKIVLFTTLVRIPESIIQRLEGCSWRQNGRRYSTVVVSSLVVNVFDAHLISDKAVIQFYQVVIKSNGVFKKVFYKVDIKPIFGGIFSEVFPDWNSMVNAIGTTINACQEGIREWMIEE